MLVVQPLVNNQDIGYLISKSQDDNWDYNIGCTLFSSIEGERERERVTRGGCWGRPSHPLMTWWGDGGGNPLARVRQVTSLPPQIPNQSVMIATKIWPYITSTPTPTSYLYSSLSVFTRPPYLSYPLQLPSVTEMSYFI